jgi:hypothetical protein
VPRLLHKIVGLHKIKHMMKLQWNFLKCPKKCTDCSELVVDAFLIEIESAAFLSINTITDIIQGNKKPLVSKNEAGNGKCSDCCYDNETKLFATISCRNDAYIQSTTQEPSNSALKTNSAVTERS